MLRFAGQLMGLAYRSGPVAGRQKKTGQHPILEPFMFMQTTSVGETELTSIIVCHVASRSFAVQTL